MPSAVPRILIISLILVDSTRRGKVSVNWGMKLTEAYARCSVKNDTYMVGTIFWTSEEADGKVRRDQQSDPTATWEGFWPGGK